MEDCKITTKSLKPTHTLRRLHPSRKWRSWSLKRDQRRSEWVKNGRRQGDGTSWNNMHPRTLNKTRKNASGEKYLRNQTQISMKDWEDLLSIVKNKQKNQSPGSRDPSQTFPQPQKPQMNPGGRVVSCTWLLNRQESISINKRIWIKYIPPEK